MSRSGSKTKLKGKRKDSVAAEPEEPEEEVVPQLTWTVIDEETAKQLREMSVEEVAKKLANVLSLKEHEVCLKQAAQLDCFVAAYWYATREKRYSDEQTCAFIALLHILVDNIKSKQLSLAENVKQLEHYVEGVSKPDSKTCPLKCFTSDVAVDIIQYICRSLFQHYRLYQYLFNHEQEEETISLRLPVSCLPDPSTLDPPPLEEAIPVELYERCLAPKPPPTSDLQDEEKLSETEEQEQQKSAEELPIQPEDSEPDILMKVSSEEVRSVLETLVESKLSALQTDLLTKLKKKEESVSTRLSKLEKNLTD